MRILTFAFAMIAFLGGLGALGYAFYYPLQFTLTAASAIQIQQVYTQAMYYAVLGLGALLASVVASLSMIVENMTNGVRVQQQVPSQAPQPMSSKLGSL